MHGMVNRALQGFIVANCGPAVWEEVRSIAGLPEDGFEAMHTYDHAVTLACFAAAVDVLDKHPNALLEDIGTYLVTDPALEPLRRLLRFGGDTFAEFLGSLEELPDRARLAMPELEVPEITLRPRGVAVSGSICAVARAGVAPLLQGALRAMADDYGALAFMELAGIEDGVETLRVEVFDAELQRGRRSPSGRGMTAGMQQDCRMRSGAGLFDRLLPMHLLLAPDAASCTRADACRKMAGGPADGALWPIDVLEMRRPCGSTCFDRLDDGAGERLTLVLRGAPTTCPCAAFSWRCPGRRRADRHVARVLSFERAVTRFGLTVSDFSPCDQTVELALPAGGQRVPSRGCHATDRSPDAAREAAELEALTDPLTQLANRRAMDAGLQRFLDDPSIGLRAAALDLDFFKQVNDTMGHAAGDHVLTEVSEDPARRPARAWTSRRASAGTSSCFCCETRRRMPRSPRSLSADPQDRIRPWPSKGQHLPRFGLHRCRAYRRL
jgi:hypothetical protein